MVALPRARKGARTSAAASCSCLPSPAVCFFDTSRRHTPDRSRVPNPHRLGLPKGTHTNDLKDVLVRIVNREMSVIRRVHVSICISVTKLGLNPIPVYQHDHATGGESKESRRDEERSAESKTSSRDNAEAWTPNNLQIIGYHKFWSHLSTQEPNIVATQSSPSNSLALLLVNSPNR
jgi:hypothetical protein